MTLPIANKYDPSNDSAGITVSEVSDPQTIRERIQSAATSAVSRLSGVVATEMRPEARAGVQLSKIVLGIVSGTILFFGTYLFVVDSMGRSNLGEAYRHVYLQIENSGDLIDASGIPALSDKIRRAALDNSATLTEDDTRTLREFVKKTLQAKIISDAQGSSLEACAPFPTDDRAKSLTACADLLDTTRRGAAGSSISFDKVKLLTDFTKNLDDHQRSFQAFWLQVAQLILLNLLLPLLTGLFGYIFGTTQRNSAT